MPPPSCKQLVSKRAPSVRTTHRLPANPPRSTSNRLATNGQRPWFRRRPWPMSSGNFAGGSRRPGAGGRVEDVYRSRTLQDSRGRFLVVQVDQQDVTGLFAGLAEAAQQNVGSTIRGAGSCDSCVSFASIQGPLIVPPTSRWAGLTSASPKECASSDADERPPDSSLR